MDIPTELGLKQTHENMEVIPIIVEYQYPQDLLNLKEGLDLGIVEVKECENERVERIVVKNNAVTPLILIEGEQIKGAKQNRMVNFTMVIPPKTELEIPVSCTEQGRWRYGSDSEGPKGDSNFRYSCHFVNSETRSNRRSASVRKNQDAQGAVWNSISRLQRDMGVHSDTSALNDVYESVNTQSYEDAFKLQDDQIGVMVFINGQFKGMEFINNPIMYSKYHKMILNSYILDAMSSKTIDSDGNEDDLDDIMEMISELKFRESNSMGLGKNYRCYVGDIEGSVSCLEGDLIQGLLFKVKDEPVYSSYTNEGPLPVMSRDRMEIRF